MPAGQKEKLIENEIAPRAIDREVSTSLHMAHMGCSSLPEALVKQSLRCGMADGWGGSMMGTEFSDVLFLSLIHIYKRQNLCRCDMAGQDIYHDRYRRY